MPGILVPQRVYVPQTGQAQQNRLENVRFEVGGQLGIRLRDAMAQNFQGLKDPSGRPAMSATGVRVALRINVGVFRPKAADVALTHTPVAVLRYMAYEHARLRPHPECQPVRESRTCASRRISYPRVLQRTQTFALRVNFVRTHHIFVDRTWLK